MYLNIVFPKFNPTIQNLFCTSLSDSIPLEIVLAIFIINAPCHKKKSSDNKRYKLDIIPIA